MLYIKIELWPGGNRARRETIAQGMIANEGTGDEHTGNYGFSFYDSKKKQKGQVKGFERKSRGPFDLLKMCLDTSISDAEHAQSMTKLKCSCGWGLIGTVTEWEAFCLFHSTCPKCKKRLPEEGCDEIRKMRT